MRAMARPLSKGSPTAWPAMAGDLEVPRKPDGSKRSVRDHWSSCSAACWIGRTKTLIDRAEVEAEVAEAVEYFRSSP